MFTKIKERLVGTETALFLAVFAGWMGFAAISRFAALLGVTSLLPAVLFGALITAFLVWTALTLRGEGRTAPACLMLWVCTLLLCATGIWGDRNLYAYLAAVVFAAVVGVACSGALKLIPKADFPRWVVILLLALFGVTFALYVGAITVARYLAYRNSAYDFGIFVQGYYSMLTRGLPYTTLERGYDLSHFAVHLSPVLYLGLPFFALFPYAETVQILEAVVLASSLIPLALLCKKLGLSRRAAVLFGFLCVMAPAMVGGSMYDFHENCFLTPLLLWLAYYVEKESLLGSLLFGLLVCTVKEDAPVYVAFLALFLLLSGRRRKIGLLVFLFSIAYFLFACWYVNRYGLGIMTYRYDNISGGGSLIGVVLAAIKDPFKIFTESFESDKLLFLALMILPLGAIPFTTQRISRYILFGGLLLVNLMPDYVYQHSMDFQYVYGTVALLLYLSVLNYSELSVASRRRLGAFACAATVLAASARIPAQVQHIKNYTATAEETEQLDEALALVPDSASVSVSTFLSPHLCNRKELYLIEDMQKTDYVVVDLRYGEWSSYPARYRALGYLSVVRIEGVVEILKAE